MIKNEIGEVMNEVVFPGLGLKFEFSKVAFRIFGLAVYKYAICIVIGIALSLVLMRVSKAKFGIKYEDVLKCAIWTIIVGTIGARLFYVIFSMNYYIHHLGEIFMLKQGGLAIYGGLIAGAITIYVYCKKKKIDYLDMFDYIAPFVALTQCIGRWGNFFNVEAYGSETKLPWRMGIHATGFVEVHPVFFYESIICLALFVFLFLYQQKRKYKGEIILYYLMGYGIARFFLEGLRADSLMLFGQRVSQYVSGLIVMLGAVFLYYRKKYVKPSENAEVNSAKAKEE